MSVLSMRALAASVSLCAFCASPLLAQQQGAPPDPSPLDITVTVARQPLSIQRAGSAVTIIRADEIEGRGLTSVGDVLRAQPGLDLTEAGGPGQTSSVRLRGAESRHTLVMIDGIRVNDPSGPSSEFDFASLALANLDRIEILRGPQSALYGSDALGGVINIITRKGRGAPRVSVTAEAGSHGTYGARATISGGTADLSYSVGLLGVRSQGFSAYGARIPRLVAFGPFDRDGYDRVAGNARFAWRVSEAVEIEAGLFAGRLHSSYDAAFAGFGYLPDTPSRSRSSLINGYLRATIDPVGGAFRHQLTLFGNQTDRVLKDVQRYDVGFGLTDEDNRYDYRGQRLGAEYQGTARLGRLGTLVFGGTIETERLRSAIQPGTNSFQQFERASYERLGWSLFALHQVALGERLDLSVGGRLDHIEGVRTFVTGRVTAAYRLPETGTRLRASLGTGAKAPSLYQNFSIYSPVRAGDPALRPEESLGIDAGIDQDILGGRGKLSATLFANRIRNLIDFDFGRGLAGPFGPVGQYVNVARASTQGLEVSGEVALIEGLARARGSYTYLHAIDETSRLALARRPRHQARIGLMLTPLPGLTIEPSLLLVGERFSSRNQVGRLAPYARIDVQATYDVTPSLRLHARVENLGDVRYQEIRDYGTSGRAFHAGLTATW